VCPSEYRRLCEEQIGVAVEHPGHASTRVLVDQAVETPHHLVKGVEDVVEDIDGEARIERRERSHLLASPDGCHGRRERYGIGGGRALGQWEDRREAPSSDDPDRELAPVDSRSVNGDMAREDKRERRRVTLPGDDLARFKYSDPGRHGKRPASVGSAMRERLPDDVEQLGFSG
jgi:hypothetical protein